MPSPSRPSYMAVLRVPASGRIFAAALLGRLSYGTVSLSLTLALTATTGSYVAAGMVMALFGLAYGTFAGRGSPRVWLPALGAALGLAIAGAGVSPNLYVLMAAVGLAGLFVAPALTTAYLVADECADPDRWVRAGAWVNTAFNMGSSAGTAVVGLFVDRIPLALCFVLAGAPALLAAAAARPRRGGAAPAAALFGDPGGVSGNTPSHGGTTYY